MAQNLQMDPVKKDYVIVNGSPVASDRVEEACYMALTIPQGKWLYGIQGQGSLLYLLEGVKRTGSIEQLFASYAKIAVDSQVVKTGQATADQITNIDSSRTGSSNQIEVIPNQTQLSAQVSFVPV